MHIDKSNQAGTGVDRLQGRKIGMVQAHQNLLLCLAVLPFVACASGRSVVSREQNCSVTYVVRKSHSKMAALSRSRAVMMVLSESGMPAVIMITPVSEPSQCRSVQSRRSNGRLASHTHTHRSPLVCVVGTTASLAHASLARVFGTTASLASPL
jgi:hypothetical protein